MQEFKAGLNKHLEASKRPGATGEGRRPCACKALCWAPSADAAWRIAAVRQSVGSQHHASSTGAPLPPPCAAAQAPTFPPVPSLLPAAAAGDAAAVSTEAPAAGKKLQEVRGAERGQGQVVPHCRPCASTLWRNRPVRCACCCHTFMRCLRRPLNPDAAGDPRGLLRRDQRCRRPPGRCGLLHRLVRAWHLLLCLLCPCWIAAWCLVLSCVGRMQPPGFGAASLCLPLRCQSSKVPRSWCICTATGASPALAHSCRRCLAAVLCWLACQLLRRSQPPCCREPHAVCTSLPLPRVLYVLRLAHAVRSSLPLPPRCGPCEMVRSPLPSAQAFQTPCNAINSLAYAYVQVRALQDDPAHAAAVGGGAGGALRHCQVQLQQGQQGAGRQGGRWPPAKWGWRHEAHPA